MGTLALVPASILAREGSGDVRAEGRAESLHPHYRVAEGRPEARPAAVPALTTRCCSWSDLPPGGCRAPHPPARARSSAAAPTAGQQLQGSLPARGESLGLSSSELAPPLHAGSGHPHSPCICNVTGRSPQPSPSDQTLAGSSSGPGHCGVTAMSAKHASLRVSRTGGPLPQRGGVASGHSQAGRQEGMSEGPCCG